MAAPTGNIPTLIPDGLKVAIGIGVLGVVVELINKVSSAAAYGLVLLILLGYSMATIGGTQRIQGFISFIKGVTP